MTPAEGTARRPQVALVGLTHQQLAEHRAAWGTLLQSRWDRLPHIAIFEFTPHGMTHFQANMLNIDAAVLLPHLPTWSRLPHLNSLGPRPLRSRDHPWGLPQLTPTLAERVNAENGLLQLLLASLDSFLEQKAGDAEKRIMLLLPEDLGACSRGRPASPWQLPQLAELARRHNLQRGALQQCRLGPGRTASPTGLLHNLPLAAGTYRQGWPRLKPGTDHYQGPLPPRCGCGRRHIAQQATRAKLRSSPPQLLPAACRWIAEAIHADFTSRNMISQLGPPTERGRKVAELLPDLQPYPCDQDGYDTDGTMLLEPPEIETEATREACTEDQEPADTQHVKPSSTSTDKLLDMEQIDHAAAADSPPHPQQGQSFRDAKSQNYDSKHEVGQTTKEVDIHTKSGSDSPKQRDEGHTRS